MLRRLALLLFGLLLGLFAAGPAAAAVCGVVAGDVGVASVEARGEIVMRDGRRARLGGLALGSGAEAALGRLAGREFGLALLAPRPDRWGRFIVDLADENGESVGLDLLVRGLARVRPEFESRGCESERLDAEAGARAAGEGIWANPGAVFEAANRAALEAQDGRFVVVAGRVRRVGAGRAKVYLDFAGHGGFSVVVARKAEPLFRRRGIDLEGIVGRNVLVRGVLDDRFGPRIEVADPSMIELDEGAKESNRGG